MQGQTEGKESCALLGAQAHLTITPPLLSPLTTEKIKRKIKHKIEELLHMRTFFKRQVRRYRKHPIVEKQVTQEGCPQWPAKSLTQEQIVFKDCRQIPHLTAKVGKRPPTSASTQAAPGKAWSRV